MNKINIPAEVDYIIERFYENGFSAYIAGGCVRDSLMGKAPSDWDIATNATPEQTKKCFFDFKIIDTGIKHGTVTIIINRIPYEVTTFRTEKNYSDNRRPDKVEFVNEISDDLSRRDFTVNAMAYNKRDGLVDLFGGREDLKNKIIRCVGEPDERFGEDALRILRAIRFGALCGFSCTQATKESIFKNKQLLKNISIERINSEFSKILLSDNTSVLYEYRDVFCVFFKGFENADMLLCKIIENLDKDLPVRLAAVMLFTAGKSGKALKDLRYSSKIIKTTEDIIACCNAGYSTKPDIRRIVSKYGYERLWAALMIEKAENFVKADREKSKKTEFKINCLKDIRKNKLCCNISELKINGDDIKELGIGDGVIIGKILNTLFERVICDELENEKQALIGEALKYVKKGENI